MLSLCSVGDACFTGHCVVVSLVELVTHHGFHPLIVRVRIEDNATACGCVSNHSVSSQEAYR